MIKNDTSCFKVSDTGICPNCKSKKIIKNGFTKNRKQQYYCNCCYKRFIDFYTNNSYRVDDKIIIQLTKEGLGIRSSARVLQISPTTLLKRIIAIAKRIPNQPIYMGKTYEVDEMRCFVRNKKKQIWIVYALERTTKKIVSFAIGRRTKKTLQNVINTLLLSQPKTIYTDGLRHYKSLIGTSIHKVKRFRTNHIERCNLTLRTHLKRLNRKTICFSRNFSVLQCILRIYFWA
ncbi:IS1 family transposase [Flavobacterium sp. AS60]|uniref:IS1 family transposase n=1 Tax=Flavobacterium anseongense TaxID=2910677 RepID=UPI001F3D8CA1|nr:IS1 family transposase [Flavobacterium sp. AS60]MCF6129100.1 IS1 family transposase [Flavobacterium sp. AS60]